MIVVKIAMRLMKENGINESDVKIFKNKQFVKE